MRDLLESKIPIRPNLSLEREWSRRCGGGLVAGIDEAGRGPLAGPVVAAAVVWDLSKCAPKGLDDSKRVSEATRERLYPAILRKAVAWGVGIAEPEEIDALNILVATQLAAARAIAKLRVPVAGFVTDYLKLPGETRPVLAIAKGDRRSVSVAAASILAKVTRDRMMEGYAEEFPQYGWETNRGYPTPAHYEAIERYGPTTLHRLSFEGVGFFTQEPLRSPTFMELSSRLASAGAGRGALAAELAAAAGRLPPRDYRELEALIAGEASRR